MELYDLWLDLGQNRALLDLAGEADRSRVTVRQLQAENQELRIRYGALLRLLIARGVFTPEEYAALVAETRAAVDAPARRAKPRRHASNR